MQSTIAQRLGAEFLGTALLLAGIVGSGIMGDQLSGGNQGLALLCNSTATGMLLAVLITMFSPISGAHFNPAVTLVFAAKGALAPSHALLYMVAQVTGAVAGVLATHVMFDMEIFQESTKVRASLGQWSAEFIATFGLVATILFTLRAQAESVASMVGLYVASAIWFTHSTCFANPAVTIGRILTDTFTGIRAIDATAFIVIQFIAAITSLAVTHLMTKRSNASELRKHDIYQKEPCAD